MDRKAKALIGVGVIAAAYLYMSGSKTEDIGSGGNFGGLGGGGSLESIEGVTDSGTPYNISFPAVDPSPIINMINDPVSSGNNEVIKTITETVSSPTTTKKSALLTEDQKEQSGSLSASLAQVFGSENQKTNSRGDYYTTSAGGGAGAIKGKSLGESVLGFLSKSYKDSKTEKAVLPTGASTYADPKYSLAGVDVKSVLQADQTKKAQMQSKINQTKIGAYTPISDPVQALKDSGIVKSTSSSLKPSGGGSGSLTATKKTVSSSSSSGIKRRGVSGTGESRVKIVRKN